jgi:uncharacterized MAPEG superfamily protein
LVDDNRSSGVETDLPRIHVNDAINSYVTGLNVSLAPSEMYLLPGDSIDFTIEVTNDTGLAASQVVLTAPILDVLSLEIGSLSGDAAVANGEIVWTTGQTLQPGQSLSRTVSFTVRTNATAGTASFVVTADSPQMDEVRQATAVLNINEVVTCGFSDGFESGVLSSAWETAVTEEGRVRVLADISNSGSYSVVLDDSVAGAAKSEAALILTTDLTGQAEATLNFSWHDLGDEYDADYDGLFVRQQPEDAWEKVYDFAGSNNDLFQNGQVDLKAAASAHGLMLSERFQIKFGFYDNFSFSPGSISAANRNPRPEQLDPQPDVERSRRMQRNDLESIPAFLAAGLLFVTAAPPTWVAVLLFALFVLSRLAHTWAYATAQNHEVRATFFSVGSIVVILMALWVLLATLF